jgi:hypothetical protein
MVTDRPGVVVRICAPCWALTLAIALAAVATPPVHAEDERVANQEMGAYYFISAGAPDERSTCTAAKSPFDDFLKLVIDHYFADHFIDVLSFQGRLPGTKGVEAIKKSDVGGNINQAITVVVSDSLQNCQTAVARYLDVREAIERSRWVGLSASREARGVRNHDKGRIVFTTTCFQRRGRSGGAETQCETVKPCRILKLESEDPKNPIRVQLPCKSASLMVE